MSYYPHKSWPGWWTIDYRVIDHVQEGDKIVKTVQRVREHIQGDEQAAADYERRIRGLHVSQARTTVNPTFKTIAAEFKAWAKTNRSENYQNQIKWNLKQLLPVFGIFPPSRITDPLIEQYKARRKETPRSCNQELEMLQIIINWGANPKRNYCRSLPFKPEKLQVFSKLPQTPDPDEFDQLLQQIASNFKQARQTPEQRIHKIALVMIMYETGIRWIEARNLQWDNVRKKDGRLYLGRTKNGKARYTFISKEVLELLDPIWSETGYMFINPRTKKIYTTMGKSLRGAAKASGIKLRGTHTLRHALGTDSMDANDGDLRGTQQLLGHEDIKSTIVYTHTATKRLKRLLEEIGLYRNQERTAVPMDKQKLLKAA